MSDGVRSADFLINASALCRSCHSRPRELDIVSEGGALCLSVLRLVHAMIARVRKSRIDLLTL